MAEDADARRRAFTANAPAARAALVAELAACAARVATLSEDERAVLAHVLAHAGYTEAGDLRVPGLAPLWGEAASYVPAVRLPPERVRAAARLLLRRRLLRGVDDELAERRALAGLVPVHGVVVGGQLAGRRLPAPRRGGDQHLARGRAEPAHRQPLLADRRAAVGVLIAVARVAVALDDDDLERIGAELVGDHDVERAAHALPHLAALADDGDDAVAADLHERVGRQHAAGGGQRLAEPVEAEREPGGRGAEAGEEAAAGDPHLRGLRGGPGFGLRASGFGHSRDACCSGQNHGVCCAGRSP